MPLPIQDRGQKRRLTIHQHRLRNIIRVVSRDHMPNPQPTRTPIQRLPPKHAAISAIPLLPHLLDNLIHCPAIQLGVAQNRKLHTILLCIPLYRLETVVAVALDALVDTQQYQVETIVVPLVEGFENRGQDRRVFAPGGADCNAFAAREEGVGNDGVVDFGFEDADEAGAAEFGVVFGTEN